MTAQLNSKPYIFAFIAIWAASLMLALIIPASWDVAWRIEIAERLIRGSLLYRDVIEVNPPLWFWSALPSTFIAHKLGIAPFAMLVIMVHIIALVGMWLLDRCVEPFVAPMQRWFFILGALVAFLLVPTTDIGQRDVPLFLAGLLWGGLAIRRANSIVTPLWLVVSIAVFSAYGFALKHYYLIIPIALEIWLLVQQKRAWRPVRVETVILAVLAVIYGAAVLKFAPNFLTDVVPLVGLSYADLRSTSVAHPLLHPLSILLRGLILILPVYFMRSILKNDSLAQVCAILICLNVVVIFLQGKGFANHYLAGKATVFALSAYALGYCVAHKDAFILRTSAILTALAIGWLALPIYIGLKSQNVQIDKDYKPTTTVDAVFSTISTEPQTSKIFVASTNVGLAFYVQWSQNRRHFSRYYGLWMIPGLQTSQAKPEKRDAATAALDLVERNTRTDIMCAAPTLIIGDTSQHGRRNALGVQTYDVKPMTFLLKDAQFNTWLMTNYNQSVETLGVTLWRSKAVNGPTPVNCVPNPL
jgi:hypothetical protein